MDVLRHGQLDYAIRYPKNFSNTEKYPLVIYLHGAGGRGRDIREICNHSFFAASEQYCENAVTVVPQCYADSWFNIFEQLQDFLCAMINLDYVDEKRVYLLGASMGGYSTWQMAMSRPELFAAIVPICGGGMYWNAARLKNMGVWAFHGQDDPTVLCEESVKMVNAVNKRGGNAKLTIYENTRHDSWTPTFNSAEMWNWLFANTNRYEETENLHKGTAQFG